MNLTEKFLRRAARRRGFGEAIDFLDLAGRLGSEAEVTVPGDLLPMAARLVARGIHTQLAFQPNLDWVLPFWATHQFDPTDAAFIPRMSWASLNVTHRNWTAVGVPGSSREVVVDPRGLVTPWFEGWSLDVWVKVGDRVLFPSRAPACEQRHIDDLPLVCTAFDFDGLKVENSVFAAVVDGRFESVFVRACVSSTNDAPTDVSVYFAIRPFNPEGTAPVTRIAALAPDMLAINDRLGVQFTRKPDRVFASNARRGDAAFFLNASASVSDVECAGGLANAYARFDLPAVAGHPAEVVALATTRPLPVTKKHARRWRAFDVADARADAHADWTARTERGVKIDLPDAALAGAYRRAKSHLLLADDGDVITPGVMTYHHYWFRDSAYLVTALDRLGLHEDARRKLLAYPDRQEADGFFLSQPGEWDSAGQAIWTLAEHVRLTGDGAFLTKMFEPLVKGADWIVRTRKKQDRPGPTLGLLPPGMSAEHFGPNDYFYWDDLWGIAGVRDAAWAAEALGIRADWVRLEKEAEHFRRDVLASVAAVTPAEAPSRMPAGPYRRFDNAAVGGLAALYPLRLMAPDDPLIGGTLAGLHEQCMLDGGFFQPFIHSGINPYLTMHMAHCHLFRREARVWPLLETVLGLATQAGTWPEAVHPRTRGGCMGDGMHLWAAADFLLLVRDLLLHEDENNLVLTPVPKGEWFAWGNRVEVRDAPTHFGPVSFRVEGFSDHIRLEIEAAWRMPPQKLAWNLPFAAQRGRVDGREVNINDNRILVPGGTSEIRVDRV